MRNIVTLFLWTFALVMFPCQAIRVTYVVESRTFCETNSSDIDNVSKSMSLVLNAVPTSAKQNLTNNFIAVCNLKSLEIEYFNFTDVIGKMQIFISVPLKTCQHLPYHCNTETK